MIPRKLLMTAIVLSVIGHMAMLALSGMIDVGQGLDTESAFTVHIEEQSKSLDSPLARQSDYVPKGHGNGFKGKSEDTVALDDPRTKYYAYLKQLKKRIEEKWSYPRDAYSRKERGVTVVKFSITEAGDLVDPDIMSSSGYPSLDREALHVVLSASPLSPLPRSFHLSMLHVIATFQYSLAE